ncbi:hypothetical protein K490DRAFT_55606 [Saccharata proteae CBS 121410]|uniref:Uncharacterized protein n=1 Tax=Saccharata proteae CBS 121410 TaxID=1314787 RepID=A0A6A5YC01_9PEZI|nr:hypothetical protein K490DRAFT_55606 [Saccharata proteae CBS 121410]
MATRAPRPTPAAQVAHVADLSHLEPLERSIGSDDENDGQYSQLSEPPSTSWYTLLLRTPFQPSAQKIITPAAVRHQPPFPSDNIVDVALRPSSSHSFTQLSTAIVSARCSNLDRSTLLVQHRQTLARRAALQLSPGVTAGAPTWFLRCHTN